MSKTPSKALVILNENVKNALSANLEDLTKQAQNELLKIAEMESTSAMRALRFGIVMHHIKAKVAHGEFQAWTAKHFAGLKHRQCNYYMRLAIAFVEKMRLNKDEVFALPGAQLELAIDDQSSSTKSVLEKAAKFIGQNSLTELLIKYDIKSVGLKKELEAEKNSEDADSNLPPEEQLRRRRETLFGETAEHLSYIRKTLTNPEQLQILDPSHLDMIETELNELRTFVVSARKPSAS